MHWKWFQRRDQWITFWYHSSVKSENVPSYNHIQKILLTVVWVILRRKHIFDRMCWIKWFDPVFKRCEQDVLFVYVSDHLGIFKHLVAYMYWRNKTGFLMPDKTRRQGLKVENWKRTFSECIMNTIRWKLYVKKVKALHYVPIEACHQIPQSVWILFSIT